ncbi:MAG: SMP-30/gluconolactonase/LRE family protein [Planctomycetaceae bacterium]
MKSHNRRRSSNGVRLVIRHRVIRRAMVPAMVIVLACSSLPSTTNAVAQSSDARARVFLSRGPMKLAVEQFFANPDPSPAKPLPAAQDAASRTRETVEQIRSIIDQQAECWNRGDIDAFMEYYWKSDDLTFSSAGTVTRGWQTTRDNYKSRYPTRDQMGRVTFSRIEVTPLGDSAAMVLGEWNLEREKEPVGGNFTLVFRRIDGAWLIVHDHTSRRETPAEAQQPLWTARPLTQSGQFTPGIEGPACDADGNVFAVNFQKQGTIGRVTPDGAGEIFVTLPEGSVGNGIRFDSDGRSFFVADYTGHNVLKVDVGTRAVAVFAHNDNMNQPNDLAISPDGTLYASDPGWSTGTGQLWRIDRDGTTTRLASQMGTTNGIEVSPDGRTLYVNESVQRNVWAFDITGDRTLKNKRLIRKFDDFGFDGMRCDVDGNLYITRHGKGTVVKMSPGGEILQEIDVLGSKPSNLCFGGPDGRTVYVTEVDGLRLVSFRVDRPGRSWAERR